MSRKRVLVATASIVVLAMLATQAFSWTWPWQDPVTFQTLKAEYKTNFMNSLVEDGAPPVIADFLSTCISEEHAKILDANCTIADDEKDFLFNANACSQENPILGQLAGMAIMECLAKMQASFGVPE